MLQQVRILQILFTFYKYTVCLKQSSSLISKGFSLLKYNFEFSNGTIISVIAFLTYFFCITNNLVLLYLFFPFLKYVINRIGNV